MKGIEWCCINFHFYALLPEGSPSQHQMELIKLKRIPATLTGVAQWAGHYAAKRKVTGSIPGQVRAHAWVSGQALVGGMQERT